MVRRFLGVILHYRTHVPGRSSFLIPFVGTTVVGRFRFVNGSRKCGVVTRAFTRRRRPTGPTVTVLGEVSSFGTCVRDWGVVRHLDHRGTVVLRWEDRNDQGIFQDYHQLTTCFIERFLVHPCDGPFLLKVANPYLRSTIRLLSRTFQRTLFHVISSFVSTIRVVHHFCSVVSTSDLLDGTSNPHFGSVSHLLLHRATSFSVIQIMYRVSLRLVVSTAKGATLLLAPRSLRRQ